MPEPILTVEHLVKGYGENTVLDDISFSVRPGEVAPAAAARARCCAASTRWSPPRAGASAWAMRLLPTAARG